MPFRLEQTASATDTTLASSVTATFTNVTQNGSIILLAWEGETGGANSANTPTDTAGNIYTRVLSKSVAATFDLEVWYAINKASTASNAVVVTDTLGGKNGILIIEEWTGADSVTVVDASNSNSGTGSPLTPGSISTVQQNELIWVAGVESVGASDLSANTGLGNLTQASTVTTNLGIASTTVASLTTSNVGFTSIVSVAWACAQVSIRKKPEGTTTSTSSTSASTFSTSSTSSSISSTSSSISSTSTSASTSSTSMSTSSTSSSISTTSSSTSSTSASSTSQSTSVSSTSSSISSTSASSTSLSSTSSSTSFSSTSSSFSSTSSSVSSTSRSTSSTSFSSTSSSSSVSTTTIPANLDYSYQDTLTLPATSLRDLDIDTNKNIQNVAIDDGDYFVQYGSEYMIQEYRKTWTNNTDNPSFTWKGRTTYDTRISPLLIQIFNVNSSTWETLANINTLPADVDNQYLVSQTINVANYYSVSFVVTFRIYQKVN